jgi:hypothetical protein
MSAINRDRCRLSQEFTLSSQGWLCLIVSEAESSLPVGRFGSECGQ